MDALFNFLLGIISSLIASAIFLYIFLNRLKPRIKISNFISYGNFRNDPNTKAYYFKFINISNSPAFDIRLRLCELIRTPAGNGKLHTHRVDIPLNKDFLTHVPCFKKVKSGDTYAPHAIICTCLEDLKPILEDQNKCIEIQIILRHGLTGLSDVFSAEFSNPKCIKSGDFCFGNDLNIM